MQFTQAVKAKQKLRLAVFGPSGAGKTFSSLRIANGIIGANGRIAVIDTERGSASKYADRFRFDTLEPGDTSVETYVEAIEAAGVQGYDVLIIDSMSHGWKSLIEEVDKLARAKYKGNTWSAWSEGTPTQKRLVEAILAYPGHLIATMRSKTEWTTSDDGRGRSKPTRVGLAPEQGKGIEYEFDLLMEISTDHLATIIKDRTGKFQDKMIEKPGEEFGAELAQWLNDGVEIKPPHWSEDPANRLKIEKALQGKGVPLPTFFEALEVQGWHEVIGFKGSGADALGLAIEAYEKILEDASAAPPPQSPPATEGASP